MSDSEKARIPAWTDRILRKGTNIRQFSYNSAPLRFSDHRPIFATFQCAVNIIDEAHRERISRELYDRRKREVGHTTASLASDDSEDDEDLIGYEPIEPGLPPASSDRQRWWLENGKMAKSTVGPPKTTGGHRDNSTMVLNPNRPSNPFTPTEEPDWVAIPRSNSRLSSFSSISSSPYEYINHSTLLSTSAASNSSPRKPPPPHDAAATLPSKVGQISLLDEQTPMQRSEAPPPPPPRRQTATSLAQSSQSSVPLSAQPAMRTSNPGAPQQQLRNVSPSSHNSNNSKAPPPIARKPVHLMSASPTNSPPLPEASHFGSLTDHQTPKPLIPRKTSKNVSNLTAKLQASRAGTLSGGMSKAAPPPVRPDSGASHDLLTGTSNSTTASGRVGLPGLANVERKPALPARPQQQQQQQAHPGLNKANVDLLCGDEVVELNGWESLTPS